MPISKHLQKRLHHVNQMKKRVLQIHIKDINQVDFVIKLSLLRKKYSQKPILYRGENEDEDIGEKFAEILEDVKKIYKKFDFPKKMIFTEKGQCEYEKAKCCWI